ncbi:DUF421 domain-containing protein [Caproiciproducens sp. NJN-50]|jgi:uncharacterized membrane protein YcaP (DUF421 family)|uniref:YetF domain-containing protein n=1 Tax=Caproiciproducens sp. NJN-50 TaxID=2507162 RepID=UPI000FFDFAC3|nr:DUF421 domain-containing protein [Caproiciproducens sp. NJN-50]QAT49003.1 DUF421 domain-containing protein [Caproiciproducens sp. NJN-50]
MNFIVICATSIFSYLSLFILTKLMGHKQISQLDFFDYITGITIGSIAAELATDLEEPWKPLLAMIIYAMVTLLLSVIARKFPRTRKYLNGTSVIIMDNGKLNRESLKKVKLDVNEFLVMCREQGYFDLSSIQTALFEYNGKLTILPISSRRPTIPEDFQLNPKQETLFAEVIMDGRIIQKNLQQIGFDLNWLSKQLNQHGIRSYEDVFLAVCDRNQNISFYKKEDK